MSAVAAAKRPWRLAGPPPHGLHPLWNHRCRRPNWREKTGAGRGAFRAGAEELSALLGPDTRRCG
jgi:hypothetical protein